MSLWRMILTAVNLVGVRFGGAALGLACQILLARLLDPEDVGIVFMTLSAAAILSLVMTAGYPSLTLTVLPRYYALGRKTLIGAFHNALWRDCLAAAVLLGLAAAATLAWAPLDRGLRSALVFGLLMAPAAALIRVTSSVANSQRRFSLSYVPDFIFRPGLLLAFLLAVLAIGLRPDLASVMAAVIVIAYVVAVAQTVLLGVSAILPERLARARHDLAPVLRGRAFAMVLIAAVATAFADIVTLIGGVFLPAGDVAMLGVAVRLAALAGFVTQVTQTFVLPDLSAAIVRGDGEQVRALILRINLIALSAISACVAVAIVFGPLILSVFGEGYREAHWALVLFMASQMFRAASGMNQHLLSLDGFQARSTRACISAVVVLCLASMLLAPALGLMGIAVAALFSEAAWAAILGVQAQRHAGYRGDIFAALRFRRMPAE